MMEWRCLLFEFIDFSLFVVHEELRRWQVACIWKG